MDGRVRPKKQLGQHFLTDQKTADRIAETIDNEAGGLVLEVGPGMGILTSRLLERFGDKLWVVEIDAESVGYLHDKMPQLSQRILEEDFLRLDLQRVTEGPLSVVGNFPYNISSQILFHLLDYRDQVVEIAGMFQREVARRLTSGPGNRDYGILSVLMGAYYDSEYLFSVPPGVFHPQPKVTSGVIRFRRRANAVLPCTDAGFRRVVKMAFNQRRKTLRNALSAIWNDRMEQSGYGARRAEQLSVDDFIVLTRIHETAGEGDPAPFHS